MKKSLYSLLFLASILIGPLVIMGTHSEMMQNLPLRLAILGSGVLAGGGALFLFGYKLNGKPAKPIQMGVLFILSAILQTCATIAISFLSDISALPFTMNWSEASRYYYASLFFAKQVYGTWAPPTVLHPSRYLMLAVPFLIPHSPIWLHRAWQVLLWLVIPALTAYLLARRAAQQSGAAPLARSIVLLIAAVIYLYLFVGDVYYHLLVPIIMILWAFTPACMSSPAAQPGCRRFLPALPRLLAVLFASAWAGISRINWFPVPAMLAATLILLEEPLSPFPGLRPASKTTGGHASRLPQGAGTEAQEHRRAMLFYTARIAAWGIFGTGTAFIAQAIYVVLSGNSASQFTTSFTSDLLWSRLLPNPTFAPGILLAILFVSLPALLIITSRLLEKPQGLAFWRRLHPLRLLGIGAMLAVLLITGLVVSVKIGGGNNIHNLDSYLVFLLVISVYFYTAAVRPDLPAELSHSHAPRGSAAPHRPGTPVISSAYSTWLQVPLWLSFAAALLPVVLIATFTSPQPPTPDPAALQEELQTIIEFSQAAHRQGGEVLFISERQLLTFGYVQGVPLVPEYERMFLMEAAMANDPAYLGKLNDDLKNHRFALIVSEPLSRQQKGASEAFGAENDVWVRRVASPILCTYMPVKTLRTVRIQLLAPRPEKLNDCP